MRGFNFNISTLFSSLGTNNSFGSFNLSDYASIKNGSYGKLLKSYYSESKKPAASEADKADKPKKKVQTEDKTGLSQIKKEADGLKTAAEALGKDELWKNKAGEADMGKITSAIKSFANEYNDVIAQSSKVTSKDVSQSVYYMTSMTGTMSKALSKIGVNVDAGGKLSVDEDVLKKANVSSVKALFGGSGSYGAQIADKASDVSRAAIMSSSVYSSNGSLSSPLDNMFDKLI